ncbi:MAG: hypothetical protein WAN30_07055 [Acidimicrobiales bacterium]
MVVLVVITVFVAAFMTTATPRSHDVSAACVSNASPPLRWLINISVSHTVSFR